MPRIPPEQLSQLKIRLRIEEVVGEYVSLKSKGLGTMAGLCPFHTEKTPSFYVRLSAGLYHCFGCGEGGDVIAFVQKMENLDFIETVLYLARRSGMEITLGDEDGQARSRRVRLLAALEEAARFYADGLDSDQALSAREFLAERRFGMDTAKAYGLGFSPVGRDELYNHLSRKGYGYEELLEAGLVQAGQGYRDRFRARLMFPIRDLTGNVVGFGARKVLEADQGPKYLNSPDSSLYQKHSLLYGLDRAKKSIMAKKQMVIVEGYTDVLACHLAGIDEAAATCGTAWTSGHGQTVRRFLSNNSRLIFAFDADAAGKTAALRAFEQDPELSLKAYVAAGLAGMDPCDLRLKEGDGALLGLVDDPQPMYEFAIDQTLEGQSVSTMPERVEALYKVLPILRLVGDGLLRQEYIRRVSQRLGIDADQIELMLPGGQTLNSGAPPASVPGLTSLPKDPSTLLEKSVLQAFLQHQSQIDRQSLIELCDYEFRNDSLRDLARVVGSVAREQAGEMTDSAFVNLVGQALPSPYRSLLEELVVEPTPALDQSELPRYLQGILVAFAKRRLLDCKSQLVRELSARPTETRRTELNREIMDIEDRIRQLQEED